MMGLEYEGNIYQDRNLKQQRKKNLKKLNSGLAERGSIKNPLSQAPIILATQEAEIRRIVVRDQPEANSLQDLSQKNSSPKKKKKKKKVKLH
jgi:hypothetical protein